MEAIIQIKLIFSDRILKDTWEANDKELRNIARLYKNSCSVVEIKKVCHLVLTVERGNSCLRISILFQGKDDLRTFMNWLLD